MSLQLATPVTIARSADRFFARPCCPRCGIEQLAPERSAFVGDGEVKHLWACEDCGTAFTTVAAFGAFRG